MNESSSTLNQVFNVVALVAVLTALSVVVWKQIDDRRAAMHASSQKTQAASYSDPLAAVDFAMLSHGVRDPKEIERSNAKNYVDWLVSSPQSALQQKYWIAETTLSNATQPIRNLYDGSVATVSACWAGTEKVTPEMRDFDSHN